MTRALPAGFVLALAALSAVHAQDETGVNELMTRVGHRIAEFYNRAKTVICIERSTVQPIDLSYSPQGFSRTVESELHVDVERGQSPGEATVVRKIRKVNGRAPREEDKTERAGCTDPTALSPEPLAFLLPPQRSDYQFRTAGTTKEKDRTAVMIDFISANGRSKAQLVEDPGGHDDCFDWTGHIPVRGRIWVDADTHDVVRVERNLRGPVDVHVPTLIMRRYHLDPYVVIARDDLTIRYQMIAFSDPDEVLLLPVSIDSVTVVRGGLQSTRRTQTFSEYKRFVTSGRVVE